MCRDQHVEDQPVARQSHVLQSKVAHLAHSEPDARVASSELLNLQLSQTVTELIQVAGILEFKERRQSPAQLMVSLY